MIEHPMKECTPAEVCEVTTKMSIGVNCAGCAAVLGPERRDGESEGVNDFLVWE